MKISILISSRRNSKYLAKFLFGLAANTSPDAEIEVLVMHEAGDTWNQELFSIMALTGAQFIPESLRFGRPGLHIYFNELLKRATGDWIIYFCDDHFINTKNWNEYFEEAILRRHLDPSEVWVLVPRFDNVGTMNHMVSRGFVEALGGMLGRSGWIDTYINEVSERIPQDRIIKIETPTFHDFTHDIPSPMDPIHTVVELSQEGKRLPVGLTDEVKEWIEEDAAKLNAAISKKAS